MAHDLLPTVQVVIGAVEVDVNNVSDWPGWSDGVWLRSWRYDNIRDTSGVVGFVIVIRTVVTGCQQPRNCFRFRVDGAYCLGMEVDQV